MKSGVLSGKKSACFTCGSNGRIAERRNAQNGRAAKSNVIVEVKRREDTMREEIENKKNKKTPMDGSFWRLDHPQNHSSVPQPASWGNRTRRSGILSSSLREPLLHLLSFWKPATCLSNPGKWLHPPSHMFKSVTKSAFALITGKKKILPASAAETLSRAFVASWLITAGRSCPTKPHKAKLCAKLSCQAASAAGITSNVSPQPFTAGEVQT